jgi:small subunit ribosomal protein S13
MEAKKPYQKPEEKEYKLIRILSTDISGDLRVYVGLTKIKGISWAMANAICKKLSLDKRKKVGDLDAKEIEKISAFIKNPDVPKMLFNRKADPESGEDKHLTVTDLDLQKEFDIKRLKKIKSYRGFRHLHGQPTRGQSTRSHFRSNRKKGVGIKNKLAATTKPAYNKASQK